MIAIRIPSGLHGSGWRFGQLQCTYLNSKQRPSKLKLPHPSRRSTASSCQTATSPPPIFNYIGASPPVSKHCSLVPARCGLPWSGLVASRCCQGRTACKIQIQHAHLSPEKAAVSWSRSGYRYNINSVGRYSDSTISRVPPLFRRQCLLCFRFTKYPATPAQPIDNSEHPAAGLPIL